MLPQHLEGEIVQLVDDPVVWFQAVKGRTGKIEMVRFDYNWREWQYWIRVDGVPYTVLTGDYGFVARTEEGEDGLAKRSRGKHSL